MNPEILCGAAAESQGNGVELGLGDGARFAIFFQGEEFLVEALTLSLKLRYHLKRVYSLARVSILEKRDSRYRQNTLRPEDADGYNHETTFITLMPTRMPGLWMAFEQAPGPDVRAFPGQRAMSVPSTITGPATHIHMTRGFTSMRNPTVPSGRNRWG